MKNKNLLLKTLLALVAIFALLTSCGGSSEEASDTSAEPTAVESADKVEESADLAADKEAEAKEAAEKAANEEAERVAAENAAREEAAKEEAERVAAEEAAAAEAAGGFPVTIESDAGSFELASAPQRIVSLSPSATELLFAIGAGDQVVAVDAYSTYPEGTPVTDLSGWDPNIEAIIAYEPDLVVIANDSNDLVAGLTAVDIPVLMNPAPADIESGYAGIAELGIATGHVDETAELVTTMREQLATAFEAAPQSSLRIYHELDATHYAASSFGFVGSVYAQLGTTNIADEADADGYGYPQLTEEYIVAADPELIIITDQVDYSADDVLARPGWEEISAIKNGNVVVVNADIASRWGPRLPQFVEAVAKALSAVPVAG